VLQDVNPLLALAVLLLGGLLGGYLARLARLPHVIGQIAVGVALGPSLLDLFTPGTLTSLGTFTQFALGFIALTVGEHLDLRALRNAGKRLALLLLAESLITPALVIAATLPLVTSPWAPILLGTMAISTAPATVLALVKESRSRGVFVKTLIAAVALNNISCIVLFSIARTAADAGLAAGSGPGAVAALGAGLLASAATIGASLLLGAGSGAVLVLLMRPPRWSPCCSFAVWQTSSGCRCFLPVWPRVLP
jgi:PTS system fructose-specific IIC component